MTVRTSSAASALRVLAGLAAAVLGGLALAPGSASAWPEDRGIAAHRVRHHRPARRAVAPRFPRAAIVSGYLPRNNNVPMYNEPPGIGSPGGPAW